MWIDVTFDHGLAEILKMRGRYEVLPFLLMADIGDISDMGEPARKTHLHSLYTGLFPYDSWLGNLANPMDNVNNLARLKQAAKNSEGIRIWWGDTPSDSCGMYWLMHALRGIGNRVMGIKMPLAAPMREGFVILKSVGGLSPERIGGLIQTVQPIDNAWREMYALYWDLLVQQNSPLRVNINGVTYSAHESFYDFVLDQALDEIRKDGSQAMVKNIIGLSLAHGPSGVNDSWYALRLKAYIEDRKLRFAYKANTFYESTVELD